MGCEFMVWNVWGSVLRLQYNMALHSMLYTYSNSLIQNLYVCKWGCCYSSGFRNSHTISLWFALKALYCLFYRDHSHVCTAIFLSKCLQQRALYQPAKSGLGVWTLKQATCLLRAEQQHFLQAKQIYCQIMSTRLHSPRMTRQHTHSHSHCNEFTVTYCIVIYSIRPRQT